MLGSLYGPHTDGRRAAIAIVYAFETGRPDGSRSTVADAHGDRGGLSYGPFQASDTSGTLDAVVDAYIDLEGELSAFFRGFLDVLEADEGSGNKPLIDLLRQAGKDQKMHAAQDGIFAERFVEPAARYARDRLGFATPLGFALVLDSFVHSGTVPGWLRRRFPESPPSRGGGEVDWSKAYIATRRAWLERKGGILAKTVYRMRTFESLFEAGAYLLEAPFEIHVGRHLVTVTPSHVAGIDPVIS
jgi:chitosanase